MTNTAVLQKAQKDINLHWYKYNSLIKKNRKRLKMNDKTEVREIVKNRCEEIETQQDKDEADRLTQLEIESKCHYCKDEIKGESFEAVENEVSCKTCNDELFGGGLY